MCRDAKPGQHQLQVLTQRQVTEGVAVLEQIGAVLPRQRIEALSDAHFVEPRVRKPRAASQQRVLVCLQEPTDEPDQLLVAFVAVGGARLRPFRCGLSRRVETGTAPRLQVAHRDQAVVGFDHREAADIVVNGQRADRRQLGART